MTLRAQRISNHSVAVFDNKTDSFFEGKQQVIKLACNLRPEMVITMSAECANELRKFLNKLVEDGDISLDSLSR